MSYQQLTTEERYHIYGLLKAGEKPSAIAASLGRSKSTLSRELSRNSGKRGYRPRQAQILSEARRKAAVRAIKFTDKLKEQVTELLNQQWSPEQISGRLKQQGKPHVSYERIYQFILEDKQQGGFLYKNLRHSNKKRKKRYGSSDRRGSIKDRVSIELRPKALEKRDRIGDWEIDLVIGKNHQGAIVTIVDRLSLMTLIAKVEYKQADLVTKATCTLLKKYKANATNTITADNGKEFSGHKAISKALGLDFYFAHPYSSWERGTNENTNGLIRQYLPKGSEFKAVNDAACKTIMSSLNNRPRKCLSYRTPKEVFEEFLQAA